MAEEGYWDDKKQGERVLTSGASFVHQALRYPHVAASPSPLYQHLDSSGRSILQILVMQSADDEWHFLIAHCSPKRNRVSKHGHCRWRCRRYRRDGKSYPTTKEETLELILLPQNRFWVCCRIWSDIGIIWINLLNPQPSSPVTYLRHSYIQLIFEALRILRVQFCFAVLTLY